MIPSNQSAGRLFDDLIIIIITIITIIINNYYRVIVGTARRKDREFV